MYCVSESPSDPLFPFYLPQSKGEKGRMLWRVFIRQLSKGNRIADATNKAILVQYSGRAPCPPLILFQEYSWIHETICIQPHIRDIKPEETDGCSCRKVLHSLSRKIGYDITRRIGVFRDGFP